MNPLVSVCIPAYNAEKYVAEALDSVLSQSYPHIEIVVVNDGSTDQTARVLDGYRMKGVKVIHQENKGQCVAANRAFRESQGELIKFFDADDILSERFVELQVEKLQKHPNSIASAEWGRFYNDDIRTYKLNPEDVWQDMKPLDWLLTSMRGGLNMMQCALWLIPRPLLEKAGVWDERLSLINDFEFMIRVILHAEGIRFTPGARLLYRSGIAQSLSQQKSPAAMKSAYLSTRLGCQYILKMENTSRARKVCANVWQQRVYEFYPSYKPLAEKAEQHVKDLGKPSVSLPAGPGLKLLARLLGWKLAKSLQYYYYQRGFSPIFK